MAGTSLLSLIDDIASLLDDVSLMTKVAAKKTAGVLGDDLALNAEQVSGAPANRELPVVLRVARGSLINKAILVPAAILITAVYPPLVVILLMLGGAYLCFEGAEKVAEKIFHHSPESDRAEELALSDPEAFEKARVKGAIRTDFILSAEIIVIALGTMTGHPLGSQIAALVTIALVMTVGVYGLVLAIVKLDDLGLLLLKRQSALSQALGRILVRAAAPLMKLLGVAGTIAMFLVGGGIVAHGIPFLARLGEAAMELHWVLGSLYPLLVGGVTGGLLVLFVVLVQTVYRRGAPEKRG